jgi:Ca-activated chloride channel homolog
MNFADPIWFIALLFLGLVFYLRQNKYRSTILFTDVGSLKEIAAKKTKYISRLVIFIRYLVLILIIVALARPQAVSIERQVSSEGIDILLAVDVSRSMAAEDFKPNNRLEVAKETIKEFVENREADRVGLVVFGGDAFTQCPLTLDYSILLNLLGNVELDMAGDGTAVGMAIATGLNRLKESKSKSKIMILLTDGENNRGQIDPISAAKLAADLGVRIYAIGVGKVGGAPIPYVDPNFGKVYMRDYSGRVVMTKIDEVSLKEISSITDGQYFRATDANSLKDIYDQIDQLEKTEIKTKRYRQYEDYFQPILWLIFGLLIFEILLGNIFLVTVP